MRGSEQLRLSNALPTLLGDMRRSLLPIVQKVEATMASKAGGKKLRRQQLLQLKEPKAPAVVRAFVIPDGQMATVATEAQAENKPGVATVATQVD